MRSIECATAERSTLRTVSTVQDGLAAARVAAMEVLINVRRFMGGILPLPLGKGTGFGEKRRAARLKADRPSGVRGVRRRTADRTACGADRGCRLSVGSRCRRKSRLWELAYSCRCC